MSVVTEPLEPQGCAFEVLPHRQTYTSADEARGHCCIEPDGVG